MCRQLYLCEGLLERLAQYLRDAAPALRAFVQKENAGVRRRALARHRHVAPAEQAHVREGVVRGVRKRRSSYSTGLQNNV
jgi:hypothetical protein